MRTGNIIFATAVGLLMSLSSQAVEVGDEVEITSAPVTALACAKEAISSGRLEILGSCPFENARAGLVVFDVAEKQVYQLAEKNIFLFQFEKAFGGGSADVTGKVIEVKDGVPVVEVSEYSVTPKPKAGGFKGCL